MMRTHCSRRSVHALFSCPLLLAACADSSPSTAPALGTTRQALETGSGDPAHAARRSSKPGSPHAPRRDCDHLPTQPTPIAFTPATAAAHSKRFAGVAVQEQALAAEPLYGTTIAQQFSAVTPENAMKWGSLQPVDAQTWNFDAADSIVEFARQNHLATKGHTLVWHQQLPPFIDDTTPPAELARDSARHIERTVQRYRRDLFAWDVVNEALADDGSGLRPTVFSNAFGERYIDRAFRQAREADHDAQLFYNDYGIEGPGAKSDAAYALMQRLLARHVPIDGIGFQAHFDARFAPSEADLVSNFQRFAALGLRLDVSELDVQIAHLGGTQAHKLAVQKQIYQRVAAACVAVPGCEAVTTWGFTDAHSWIDATFGPDDPLLFDDNYQKKPAYFGYVDGFLGVPLDDPALEPNLVGNASFEAGLDGWSALGDAALASVVDRAHTGLRSARASGRTATWQGPSHDVTSLVASGRQYGTAVWASIAGAASADVNLTAQVTCTGQAPVFLPLGSASATDSDWIELTGTLNVPSCALQSVSVYVEGPDAGVDILVDDLALREVPLPNLIDNPDFESGTGGWFGFGPVTLGTTSDAHSGSQAALATARTDTWNGIAIDLTSRVAARASYHAEGWLKISAPSDRVALTAAVTCADGSQQFLPVGSGTGTNSGWTFVSGSVVVPDCGLTSFVLYAEGPAAGVSLSLDDVAFRQLDAGQAPNVIQNPGFESGTDSWFQFGPVSIDASADRTHGGAHSGHVSGRTDTWMGLATSLLGRLTPGASYSVSAWAEVGSGSSPVNLTFQNACDGAADNFTPIAAATANAATWTQLQGTLTAPNCTLTNANFYIEGAPAGVDIYLDDVEVRQLP